MKNLSEKPKKEKVYITEVDERRQKQYRKLAVFIVRHPIVKSVRGRVITKRNVYGPIYALIAGLGAVTLAVVISTMQILVDTPVQQQYYDPRDVAAQQAQLLAQDTGAAKPAERSAPLRRGTLPSLPITIVTASAQQSEASAQDLEAPSQEVTEKEGDDSVTEGQEGGTDSSADIASRATEENNEKKEEDQKDEKEEDFEDRDPIRTDLISKEGKWTMVLFDEQSYEVSKDVKVDFDTDICAQNFALGEGHEDVYCAKTSKLDKKSAASKAGKDKCPRSCNIGAGCALWNTEQDDDEFSLYIGNYLCL